VGGFADGLNDYGDGAALHVEIGDREGDTLAVFIDARHDEVAGAGGTGHVGRAYFPKKCRGTELLSADDWVHPADPSFTGKRIISDFKRSWYCSTNSAQVCLVAEIRCGRI
jgi:hypothetical protein